MEEILVQDLLVSLAAFCEQTGKSPQLLEAEVLANRMFIVEIQGQHFVPSFFLEQRYDRRQMASVCKLLGSLPGGSKLQFFTTPKGSLGGQTPLEALADRKFAAVRRTAQGFAER